MVINNFIGWILPFTFGIIYARCHWDIAVKPIWKNVILLVAAMVLLVLTNFNVYTWLFSPVLAIVIALIFNNLLKEVQILNNTFIMLGKVSAFLFAIHPLIRYVYVHTINSVDFVWIMTYFVVSVIVAIGYKRFYNWLF